LKLRLFFIKGFLFYLMNRKLLLPLLTCGGALTYYQFQCKEIKKATIVKKEDEQLKRFKSRQDHLN